MVYNLLIPLVKPESFHYKLLLINGANNKAVFHISLKS
jgi:hypothetical protein